MVAVEMDARPSVEESTVRADEAAEQAQQRR